jgi:glutamate-1-semialdehyde 2,1-aminomutase/spore coat polysaccharide biosynthesis protein SpsF
MKIVAVCQARMGSTRLPGKVLRDLGGRPTLDWVTQAALNAPGVDQVVVGTSVNPENNVIEGWCRNNGNVSCIRGSEDDVLNRYRTIIEETKADAIVRLTGDCPMLDSRVIGEVIALYKTQNCAYASNIDPPTWPDGLDVEVISSQALIVAEEEAIRHTDRDTVTRYIARNRTKFPAQTLICPLPHMQKERWVLDSPEDYEFLKKLVALFPAGWVPNYLEILDALNKNPELRKINQKYLRNERFFDSLAEEADPKIDFRNSRKLFNHAIQTIPFAAQTFSKSHIQYPSNGPLFLSHGDGGYAFDVDGNDYVDLVSGLLPNILGYRDPDVDYAIRSQLNSGISFSLATELESKLSDKLVEMIPCAEMVKYGKNGADATAAAVRVARAYTKRNRMMIIEQSYHGWHDWSIASTERNLGVLPGESEYNIRCSSDLDKIEKRLKTGTFAGVILEPEGRTKKWLESLKKICEENGTILIFDEVITGFRYSLGGYQKHIGVTPDLSSFGKAMANGMPISAIVGRKDLMKRFEPPNNIFYSGTFFGEALSLAASLATIEKMEKENVIGHLWRTGETIKAAVTKTINNLDLAEWISLYGEGPLVRIAFHNNRFASANLIKSFFIQEMIRDGVLIIASNNVCYAHGEAEVRKIIASYGRTLAKMKQGDLEKRLDGREISPAANLRRVS